jgi:hypothetical protein
MLDAVEHELPSHDDQRGTRETRREHSHVGSGFRRIGRNPPKRRTPLVISRTLQTRPVPLMTSGAQASRVKAVRLVVESRGVAKPGIASALGAEDRWFESSRPDQFSLPLFSFAASLQQGSKARGHGQPSHMRSGSTFCPRAQTSRHRSLEGLARPPGVATQRVFVSVLNVARASATSRPLTSIRSSSSAGVRRSLSALRFGFTALRS